MAAPRVSQGLSKVRVPVYVGAGIDTKNNPKLVQPGSLLELENMYQLRTGELRLRNGFAKLAADTATLLRGIFAVPGGIIGAYLNGSATLAENYFKYSTLGWTVPQIGLGGNTSPVATAAIAGIAASTSSIPPNSVPDLVDGSTAASSGLQLTSWVEQGSGSFNYQVRFLTGQLFEGSGGNIATSNGRPPVCCSDALGQGNALFYVDNAGTPSIKAVNYGNVGTFSGNSTVVLNGVSAAQPWIDAIPIPGTTKIAIAYRASAGGVSVLAYDLSTRTVATGPVNIPAADATQCLGWMDNSLGGSLWLAMAGGTSGVVVRSITAATMAVSGTTTIDALATANVRQITGHITGPGAYSVFWEVSGAPAYNSVIRMGTWNGSVAAAADFAPSYCLYSRTFLASDGEYYLIGVNDSGVQPTYSIIPTLAASTSTPRVFQSSGQIMSGTAGGRRVAVSSLANAASGLNGTLVPLARKQQLTTTTGTITGLRSMNLAEVTPTPKFYRPRELGGTFFLPGGLIQRDDGVASENATVPFFLEAPSLASSATGGMTASGSYSYRCVLKRIDATGRVTRSAGSVVTAITLGAGDGQVTLTLQNPRLLPGVGQVYYIEVYRAGPAATGATNYNKVGEAVPTAYAVSNTLTFVDNLSDATAQAGELLYATGGVLENFQPPASTLLEVNGRRVWIVSAEDTTLLWYSKEYKPGLGLGFNPALTMPVHGDGYGGMTALAAMDGRLIPFKSQAIYVITGDGPNDLGQGTFNPPQAISLSVGTTLPGSVVATPDGIMFQGAAGIYLLDRGLGLTYLGKPVEQYTLAENVVDASLVQGINQVRFVMASGRCLVWDYDLKTWCTYKLRVDGSTIVACANVPSGWCYALANGTVYQETPGVYSDVNGTSTAIVPRLGFPHLNLGGLAGYQRIYSVEALFDVIGDHTFSLDCEFDYSGAVTGTPRTKAVTAGAASAIVEYNPPSGHAKSTSIRPVITTSVQAAGSGAFRFTGLAVTVGVKRGSNTPYTNRLT